MDDRWPPEAPLRRTDSGLLADGPGWFVVNLVDAEWRGSPGWGRFSNHEIAGTFAQFAFGVHVLEPGERNGLYHGEDAQEGFLVLSGECLLIVEGEERRLRQWDLVHAPAWTRHIFVGAGDGPCAILMIGARVPGRPIHYPVDPVARRHQAGVEQASDSAREAYAAFRTGGFTPQRYRPGDLGEPA